MSTKTNNVSLNIIEGIDGVSQELFNQNSEIIDGEFGKVKQTQADVTTLKDNMTQAQQDISALSSRVLNNATNISNLSTSKVDKSSIGQADGVCDLDAAGRIPISRIPSNVKERRVVANIAARNSITDVYDGLIVRVIDATGDPTVSSGWAEYMYDLAHTAWVKISEGESLDVVLSWLNVQNIPDVLKALSVLNGKLAYNGSAVYQDKRVIVFKGGDSEFPYEWDGSITKIRINATAAQTTDLIFSVEKATKANYVAKAGTWDLIGGSQFTLPAGEVYKEIDVSTPVSAGDVIRASTAGDDTDISFEVIILNN